MFFHNLHYSINTIAKPQYIITTQIEQHEELQYNHRYHRIYANSPADNRQGYYSWPSNTT